jgi:Zn-dependent protease with chaperone function
VTIHRHTLELSAGAESATPTALRRSAATASRRLARAVLLLGVLGLASFGLVFLRLLEAWRVSPRVISHHVVIFGLGLSYPVANLAAVIVLVLALLGAVVTTRMLFGVANEVAAARSFERWLAACSVARPDGAHVIEDERPRAFCAGLVRPRVYVTTGALAVLDERALAVVLTHERHHARRRDPLRLATNRVLERALFFVPGLHELGLRQQALAEISADESAIGEAPANRAALASAMLSFADSAGSDASVGIDPARVDYLLGEPPSWRFPALICASALLVVALLAAIAELAGREATGAASLAPPFLSAQPCVVVLAVIPALIGVIAVRLWRRQSL